MGDMKQLSPLLLLLAGCSSDQRLRSIPAPSLTGAPIANDPTQNLLVLLPPGYQADQRRYPVVYFLPGFATDIGEYLDGTYDGFRLDQALLNWFEQGGEPFILVLIPGRNQLGGSFFANSTCTGRWEDFVVRDVLGFVESRYRVRMDRRTRGIAGESMGGTAALHLAMRHPDLFSAVFALSPGLFDERGLEDMGFYDPAQRAACSRELPWLRQNGVDPAERFVQLVEELQRSDGRFNYRRAFFYAYGAAFAPLSEPPFADFTNESAWRAGFGDWPAKVATHGRAFRSLQAIRLDVGQNDRLKWIPRGAKHLADLLIETGAPVKLSSHDGGHDDRFGLRLREQMLPFFSSLFKEATP